jgi:hypothetical protein
MEQTNQSINNTPNKFVTLALGNEDHAIYEQKRALIDSWHDNPESEDILIIKELYKRGLPRTLDEAGFVTEVLRGPIPSTYFLHRSERVEEQVNGFLTPELECLVNNRPFTPFTDATTENIVFPYDQGPALFKYFKGSKNCLFFSDAVDTAPKKTKRDSQPYWAPFTGDLNNGHRGFVIYGKHLGFNEEVVKLVAFADFQGDPEAQKVGCKVLIYATAVKDGKFKWYDLANENTRDRPASLADALNTAKFKMSNKPSGFFIGNEEGAIVLANRTRPPIIHLCTVVAKILGDLSVGIAASAQMRQYYKDLEWRSLYQGNRIPGPAKFIHNTGDRTSSIEASRLGADALYTFPMRDGSAQFRFIPGERMVAREEVPATFITRMLSIRLEVETRYNSLLKDLNEDFDKYKVDGEPVPDKYKDSLIEYIRGLRRHVKTVREYALNDIDSSISQARSAVDQQPDNRGKIAVARTAYETLNNRKIRIMPHSPTISHLRMNGTRKSVISRFILNTEYGPRGIINLRDEIYRIKTSSVRITPDGYVGISERGGTRRRRNKRTLRKVHRMKGGTYEYPATFSSEQKEALKTFEAIVDRIIDRAITAELGDTPEGDSKETLLENLFQGRPLESIRGFLTLVKTCNYVDGPAYDELLMKLLEDDLEELTEAIANKQESVAICQRLLAAEPAPVPVPVPEPALKSAMSNDDAASVSTIPLRKSRPDYSSTRRGNSIF